MFSVQASCPQGTLQVFSVSMLCEKCSVQVFLKQSRPGKICSVQKHETNHGKGTHTKYEVVMICKSTLCCSAMNASSTQVHCAGKWWVGGLFCEKTPAYVWNVWCLVLYHVVPVLHANLANECKRIEMHARNRNPAKNIFEKNKTNQWTRMQSRKHLCETIYSSTFQSGIFFPWDTVECKVWSVKVVKCCVGSLEHTMWSQDCDVWMAKCRVWSIK